MWNHFRRQRGFPRGICTLAQLGVLTGKLRSCVRIYCHVKSSSVYWHIYILTNLTAFSYTQIRNQHTFRTEMRSVFSTYNDYSIMYHTDSYFSLSWEDGFTPTHTQEKTKRSVSAELMHRNQWLTILRWTAIFAIQKRIKKNNVPNLWFCQ